MNPAFGLTYDLDPEPWNRKAPSRLGFNDLRLLARNPHPPPPRDPHLWLAWANGERVPGPRWERVLDVEAKDRVAEARRLRSLPAFVPELGPWETERGGWARYWLGPQGGHTKRAAFVRYLGHRWGGERWYACAGGSFGDYHPSRDAAMAWCDGRRGA